MDINELRAEITRREKAATAKISRLRRTGVMVSGSTADPRRSSGRIARYNTKAAQGYLNDLNSFVSRKNRYVAGVEGAPISLNVYNRAQATSERFNALVTNRYESVKSIHIPEQGMTIQRFDEDVKRARARGSVSRPLAIESREAFEFTSEASVARWEQSLTRKMKPGYRKAYLKFQRMQMMKALDAYGDPELDKMARELTDEQFDVLWNYTDAPRMIFQGYHAAKLFAANRVDDTASKIHEDATDETHDWFKWASTLNTPPRNGANGRKKG